MMEASLRSWRRTSIPALVVALGAVCAFAAAPPNVVNYQGVLRDQNDKPLSGSYDMVFRFMDAATAGNEIMTDQHALSTGNPVTVTGGLFNVPLGSGIVADGSGPGAYTSLDAVFRDYGGVWLEVRVAGETLAPRTKFQSAAFALNATNAVTAATATNASQLNGYDPSFFLNTSSTYQTKTGPLRVTSADPSISVVSAACSGATTGISITGCSDTGGYFNGGTGVVGAGGSYGVRGYGTVGGYFSDGTPYRVAYLGDAPDDGGIAASGQVRGGYFSTPRNYGDFCYSDRGFYEYGVWAHGYTDGAYIESSQNLWGGVAWRTGDTIVGNGGKSFVQNHPELKDRIISYTALEGDEVGTYTRGTARLSNGEARVPLGETYRFVTNPELGLTVYVAPLGAPARLYVAAKSTSEIVVKSAAGDPDVEFDYIVLGLRLGFETKNVVQEKEMSAPIPDLSALIEQRARHPELAATTARARFEAMDRIDGRTPHVSYPEADAIVAKIQTADRGITPPRASADARVAGLEDRSRALMSASGAAPAPLPAAPRIDAPEHAAPVVPALEFDVTEPVTAGDLLALDATEPGKLHRAAAANDTSVVGIAERDSTLAAGTLRVAVATATYALVKVDAQFGAIHPGDFLVSSPTPGNAMAAKSPIPGTVIGKALEPFESGSGAIRVLLLAR